MADQKFSDFSEQTPTDPDHVVGVRSGANAKFPLTDFTLDAEVVDVDDLDAADPMDGTEKIPALQSGLSVAATSQQLLGDALDREFGHNGRLLQSATHLYNTPSALSVTTDDTLFGNEPVVTRLSGTGASVSQVGLAKIGTGIAELSTGTTATGRAGIQSTQQAIVFSSGVSTWSFGFKAGIDTLATVAQDFTVQIGILNSFSSLATSGVWFEARQGVTNWRAISGSTASPAAPTDTDTGVAVAAVPGVLPSYDTFRIDYDPTTQNFTYYINGSLVATHADSTNAPSGFTLGVGANIIKSAGTTARKLYVDAMKVVVTLASSSVSGM